jgi:hypothetical protein
MATKEWLAALLNGREIGKEITKEEEQIARESGLVVLFGASDDLAEFRGAIEDEVNGYGGRDIMILDGKLLPADAFDCGCEWAEAAEQAALARAAEIESVWCEGKDGEDGPLISWTYITKIPHATFDVMEDGEVYCRGIVFDLADAKKAA